MEKQDAAVPLRVRVDVSQGRAGGDSFALGVRISVVYLYEIRRRRSVHDAYALNPI